jgi:hypothetical protein
VPPLGRPERHAGSAARRASVRARRLMRTGERLTPGEPEING